MRTQAQQHQGLGFREACRGEAVLLLKLFHGVTGRLTPDAIRFIVEEAGFGEGRLYFLHSRRLHAHLKVMVVVPPAHVLPAHAVSSLLLLRGQPDIRQKKRRESD